MTDLDEQQAGHSQDAQGIALGVTAVLDLVATRVPEG
jgi:hypothetical protein